MPSRGVLLVCVLFMWEVSGLHPIVFFPGYSFSKLVVTVNGGTEPGCPANGSFEVVYQMQDEQNGFTQECMMNYLELAYDAGNTTLPFTNRPDVKITMPGRTAGSIECLQSTAYAGMIQFFSGKGYVANSTFLASCYDWRIDPAHDVLDGPSFMENSMNLVKQAYAAAGNQKVWVIGHSNGPIMGLYFLTHLTLEFKQQYIAGFIPLSGNIAGQGLLPSVFLEGLSVANFDFFLPSAKVHRGWPQNYLSSPQPAVFTGANSVTFFQTNTPAKQFSATEADYDSFFQLQNNTFGLSNWRNYVGLVGPHTPPNVYTFAIWGNNISTVYGLHVESFTNVTILDAFVRNGDTNQEDIDNESTKVWNTTMPTGCYDFWVAENVNHFELSDNQQVLEKIYSVVSNPPNVVCSHSTSAASTIVGSLIFMVLFPLLVYF